MASIYQHSIEDVVAEVQRRWGSRGLQLASYLKSGQDKLPTGIHALDNLLGGGVPAGKVTAFEGKPTSGTTTLAYHLITSVHAQGAEAVYIDLQGTFDGDAATTTGADLDRLLVVHPPDALDALNLAREIAASHAAALIVLDLGAETPGIALRRLYSSLGLPALLLLSNVPVEGAHVQLRTTCTGWLYDGGDITGCRAQATLLHGPGVPSGRTVCFDLRFGTGGGHA